MAETATEPAPFTRVRAKEYGYHPHQVDEFIRTARAAYQGDGHMTSDDVREKSFEAVRKGYLPAQVDQMLDRLEDVFRRAERDTVIANNGKDVWNQQLDDHIRTLMGRLELPDRERFRRPRKRRSVSYNIDDVDELCHRLQNHLTDVDGLTVSDLRSITFRAATGKKGYDEAQVDAFIQDAVELLVVLE